MTYHPPPTWAWLWSCDRFWATVYKTVCPMLSDRCLSSPGGVFILYWEWWLIVVCCLLGKMDDPDRPLKDYGSFVHVQPSEADIAGMTQFILCMMVWFSCDWVRLFSSMACLSFFIYSYRLTVTLWWWLSSRHSVDSCGLADELQSLTFLWPPCIAGCRHMYFRPVSFFFLFFPRLISAVGD